jgi:hypothetical protein
LDEDKEEAKLVGKNNARQCNTPRIKIRASASRSKALCAEMFPLFTLSLANLKNPVAALA